MLNLFKRKNPNFSIFGLPDLLLFLSMITGIISLILSTTTKTTLALILLFVSGIIIILSRYTRENRIYSFESKYFLILEAFVSLFCFGFVPMIMTIVFVGINHYSTVVVGAIYMMLGVLSVSYNLARDLNKDSIKIYIGLPITTISFLYPIINLLCYIFGNISYEIMLTLFLLIVGVLFVMPIKVNRLMKKSK